MLPALTTEPSQYDRAIAACLAGLSTNTQRAYTRCIGEFRASGQALTREGVSLWAQSLSTGPVGVNQAISAVKRLASEAAALGWLQHETAIQIGALKGRKYRGVRTGRWLTLPQVRELLALPDRQMVSGRRDAAVLALLLGCGIRRQEACTLTVAQVQQGPGGMLLSNLVGKGQRVRTLGVPVWAARDITAWVEAAELTQGKLLRSVSGAGVVNGSLSPSAIRDIVRWYAGKIGVELAPHDARRTFARLSREGGAPLEVIQASMGHASIETTTRYINSTESADAGRFIGVDIDSQKG